MASGCHIGKCSLQIYLTIILLAEKNTINVTSMTVSFFKGELSVEFRCTYTHFAGCC